MRAALIIQQSLLGRFEANLTATLEQVARAAELGADLAVFPEMNLTGYGTGSDMRDLAYCEDKWWTGQLAGAAAEFKMTILVGLAEKSRNGRTIHATHMIFGQDGVDRYRKVHLAPQEAEVFTAGNRVRTFRAGGLSFGVQLCYDAHFPELSLAMAMDGADIVFMPHASPNGSPDAKLSSWLRHMTARAFDNGIYVAAVNPCGENDRGLSFPGVAVVIGPDGLVKSKTLTDCPSIHMTEIDTDLLKAVRSHRMRYFLPHRRPDLFPLPARNHPIL